MISVLLVLFEYMSYLLCLFQFVCLFVSITERCSVVVINFLFSFFYLTLLPVDSFMLHPLSTSRAGS